MVPPKLTKSGHFYPHTICFSRSVPFALTLHSINPSRSLSPPQLSLAQSVCARSRCVTCRYDNDERTKRDSIYEIHRSPSSLSICGFAGVVPISALTLGLRGDHVVFGSIQHHHHPRCFSSACRRAKLSRVLCGNRHRDSRISPVSRTVSSNISSPLALRFRISAPPFRPSQDERN